MQNIWKMKINGIEGKIPERSARYIVQHSTLPLGISPMKQQIIITKVVVRKYKKSQQL